MPAPTSKNYPRIMAGALKEQLRITWERRWRIQSGYLQKGRYTAGICLRDLPRFVQSEMLRLQQMCAGELPDTHFGEGDLRAPYCPKPIATKGIPQGSNYPRIRYLVIRKY